MEARQPVGGMLRLFGREVEFGAVAGRQNGGLAHRIRPRQIMQGLIQPLRLERNAFADRERCGVVVQAEGEELHAEQGSVGAERIIAPRKRPKIEPNQPLLASSAAAKQMGRREVGPSSNSGGQSRNRTTDTRIFNPLLYQLS